MTVPGMTVPGMNDLGLGVVSGLAAAGFSAVSYLVSRHYGLGQRTLGRKGAWGEREAGAAPLTGGVFSRL